MDNLMERFRPYALIAVVVVIVHRYRSYKDATSIAGTPTASDNPGKRTKRHAPAHRQRLGAQPASSAVAPLATETVPPDMSSGLQP